MKFGIFTLAYETLHDQNPTHISTVILSHSPQETLVSSPYFGFLIGSSSLSCGLYLCSSPTSFFLLPHIFLPCLRKRINLHILKSWLKCYLIRETRQDLHTRNILPLFIAAYSSFSCLLQNFN